jgi:hypothetical protein
MIQLDPAAADQSLVATARVWRAGHRLSLTSRQFSCPALKPVDLDSQDQYF